MSRMIRSRSGLALVLTLAVLLAACGSAGPKPAAPAGQPAAAGEKSGDGATKSAPAQAVKEPVKGPITVYSGRTEDLISPILQRFQQDTGIEVKVRYGDTAQLAATLLEEGDRSPADVYIAQDAGALGAVAKAGRLQKLPDPILQRVESRFRAPQGTWVGVSGRARTVVYNTEKLKPADLPDSIQGFTDPKWKGRIGWPPTNGSFQAFVTALVELEGEAAARAWLQGIQANNPKVYPKNTPAVAAVAAGEVDVAFVNHYYLFQFLKEQGKGFKARNYHPRAGGAGAMINVAGAGILKSSKNTAAAQKLVEYLLSTEAQQYFADKTFEYPLVSGVKTHEELIPLDQIKTPNLDLGDLDDLDSTLKLMRDVGVL